ncbi:MAG: hypothetical protein ACTHK2_04675 [Dokdonella sp.]|uniref:hypothetical protein n=1 Tax=Dokdonella sp. TaxID=2291710 RepID=UPI003F800D5F
MNCQPGDLARVIPPGAFEPCPLCGKRALAIRSDLLVVCEELLVAPNGNPMWRIAEPIRTAGIFPCGTPFTGTCFAIADDLLRPIRDPGEDAVDEMLQRIGAPTYDADPALLGREAAEPTEVRP